MPALTIRQAALLQLAPGVATLLVYLAPALVWWRRSVKIGVFIHVGMIVVQLLGLTALVFGLAPAP